MGKAPTELPFRVLCLVGAVVLGRVAVIAQRLEPWQDFWVVFLFSVLLIWAAVATFIARSHFAQRVSKENIEARLNEWILKFRFASQKLADSSGYRFAYRVTAADGQAIVIGRRQSWITIFVTGLTSQFQSVTAAP